MFRHIVRPYHKSKILLLAGVLALLSCYFYITSPYSSFRVHTSPTTVTPEHLVAANATLLLQAPRYLKAILDPADSTFPRLQCPQLETPRYDYLRHNVTKPGKSKTLPKYFFALDLRQCVDKLPRLLGSIVETIRFLGPEQCTLSIVEGGSTDGTYEVLISARKTFADIGIQYVLVHSDLDTKKGERIATLAKLRNLALEPLIKESKHFDPATTVIFLNDISMCMEDVLELIHQKFYQEADMTCAMDWTYAGNDPTFYDIWIARTMTGETFFEIGSDGNWNSAWNIFWNTPVAQQRYNAHKPFQVFSCWNGMTAFSAAPFVQQKIKFRSNMKTECFQGEPRLFCKDMWRLGHGKIAVVPSINIEYTDEAAKKIKDLKGRTNKWVKHDGTVDPDESITWEKDPPKEVKCITDPDYAHQHFVPWNQGFT